MINIADGIMTTLPSHIDIKFCIQSNSSPHSLHKTNIGPNDAFEFTKMTMFTDLITKKSASCNVLQRLY